MNKQGRLLAVLEVINAAVAIATVARREVRELLKATGEVLAPPVPLMPLGRPLPGRLVNPAERREPVAVAGVAPLQGTAEGIMHAEGEIGPGLRGGDAVNYEFQRLTIPSVTLSAI